jgi:hypothetical protein
MLSSFIPPNRTLIFKPPPSNKFTFSTHLRGQQKQDEKKGKKRKLHHPHHLTKFSSAAQNCNAP